MALITYDDFMKVDMRVGEIIQVEECERACTPNFPPQNVAGFTSEVLLLSVPAGDGSVPLLEPSRRPAQLGGRVY